MSAGVSTDEIARAVEELEQAFPGQVTLDVKEEDGAVLGISDVQLSARWTPQTGELWFLVPFHYPDAPIYPYYVVGATPTGGLVQALQSVDWRGTAATQVSLRHSAWDPANDNAVGCALQAMAWLRAT